MATLEPGTWAVENKNQGEIDAFGDWLDANRGSVSLLQNESDALIFEPGREPHELAVFQVHDPVEWTLTQVAVPFQFPKEARPDAVPGSLTPESPGKGKPDGAAFGGGLFSLDQLVWAIILGLYLYSQKGQRR